MKIYCLVENTKSSDDFECEHGLSLFIDTGTRKILFDMGESDAYIRNAEKLGLDLSKADMAILSHGHYDHGGGLKAFLEINKAAPIYVSRYSFEPHYNGQGKYIGLDTSLLDNDRLIFLDKAENIDTGITIFNCNGLKAVKEADTFGQYVIRDGTQIKEDYIHEQYLLIKENDRSILFSGCSHKGILNIVNWIDADIIVGGFHFSKMELDDTLRSYASQLGSFNIDFYTCHCTGNKQYEFMKKSAEKIKYISSGDIIEI